MNWRSLTVLTICIGVLSSYLQADEQPSHRYEDDAWYDISEWFDGNDYNPTDEAIGRWDDETYDASDDVGTDQDNDSNVDWSKNRYGYFSDNKDTRDNWYYDYSANDYSDYNDRDNDGYYDYSVQYYDWNNDGVFDSYAGYFDTDRDGIYESSTYYWYSKDQTDDDAKNQQNAKQQQDQKSSKVASLTGTIESTKEVKSQQSKNLVVRLKDTGGDKASIVDLGPVNKFDAKPKQGDSISAKGAMIKVGDKTVLLAQSVDIDGTTHPINRSGRELSGKIVSTKKVKMKDGEHQFAKVKTDKGKHFMVDMGAADKLSTELAEGKQITVNGPAVKVKDRHLIIAQSFTVDGKTKQIERRTETSKSQTSKS